ncbi:hypothetical protein EV2_033723 [Malus domestica]
MRFEESVERSDCVNLGKTNGDVGEYRGFKVVEGVDYESRNSSKGLGRLFHEECEQTGWSYNPLRESPPPPHQPRNTYSPSVVTQFKGGPVESYNPSSFLAKEIRRPCGSGFVTSLSDEIMSIIGGTGWEAGRQGTALGEATMDVFGVEKGDVDANVAQ